MKKAAFLSLLFFPLLLACSHGPSAEEQAMEAARVAAQGYYDFLLRGDYQQFLCGRADADSLPSDYFEQLQVACHQFMIQQRQAHDGMVAARATRAVIDSSLHVVQVFLQIDYADSTREEIVVPMVECGGEWKMR